MAAYYQLVNDNGSEKFCDVTVGRGNGDNGYVMGLLIFGGSGEPHF